MYVMDVPAWGLWSLFILVLAIAQLPPLMVLGFVIAYVWTAAETTPAVIFTIYALMVSGSDSDQGQGQRSGARRRHGPLRVVHHSTGDSCRLPLPLPPDADPGPVATAASGLRALAAGHRLGEALERGLDDVVHVPAAHELDVDGIRARIGADSLEYLSPDHLVAAIDRSADQLCLGCFTREYPIDVQLPLDKFALERPEWIGSGR